MPGLQRIGAFAQKWYEEKKIWKYEKREIMSMDKECNTADDAQIYQISSRHKPGMRSPASFSS